MEVLSREITNMQYSLGSAYHMMTVLAVNVLGGWIMQGIDCCQQDASGLYFIDDHNIKCVDFGSLHQSNPTIHTVVPNIAEGTAIDIDIRNNIVYWSDIHAWTINRKNLTSGEVKVILRDNIGEVYSIAVEWESGLIYWTDYLYGRIEVANTDGSARRTLVTQNVKSPIGIAVDPVNGYMVWCDYDYTNRKILRADLTGENQRVLVDSFYGVPFYVIIDYSENRVYWVDIHFAFTFIGSVDLNGQNLRAVKFLHQVYFPFDLAIFQNNLYWADANMRGLAWFPFKNSPVTTLTVRRRLSQYTLLGVAASDLSRQPMATGQHPCAINNGNCSDLCLLTPGRGRKCACPQGITLGSDGMTCNNESTPSTQSPPLPAVKVRLAGSNVHSQGRVEVLYNGQWGTICDDYWGISEAHVICRMLNYSGAEFAPREAYFGPGPSSSPIWLDSVKCRGDESTIAACRSDGWRQHDCQHSEDASVVCWSESAPAGQEPTLAPGPHPELEIRLYGGDTQYEGGVEIKLNGTWGTICDDSWGIEEANVICRMLNFTEGALSTQCCGLYNGYGIAERIWLDDVHCVGDEQSIAACRHRGWGSHNCRHTEDVGVVCKHLPLSTPGQIVRLADGARESEGRVEIFHDGHWGTVCDDHWDIKDANVVCKMLNYSQAVRAPGQAFFGRGNGKIWQSKVKCVGNETTLLQCENQGWGVNTCDHHEDASVICQKEAANLVSKNFILACESGRSLIYHIPLDNSFPEEAVSLALKTDKPLAITFHSKENMAYWTEQSGSIVRAHLDGSFREVIVTGLTFPSGIAIDYVGQNLYFTDTNGINVSKLDGSYQTSLINLTSAHGITLDDEAGYIYFTSTGINPQILRADMDGKNQVVLANLSSIRGTTLDIALDKVNKRLYYSDSSNNLVKYFDLATLVPHPVLSDRPHGPVGLTLFNGTLYWTGGESQTFSGGIYKAEANNVNGSSVHKVTDLLSFPKGLYAHDSGAVEPSGNHPCAKQNGRCSHLCLIKPGGYSCLCPIHIYEPCQTTPTSVVSTTRIQISASVSRSPSLNSAHLKSSPLSHRTMQSSPSLSTAALSLFSSSSSTAASRMRAKTSIPISNARSPSSPLAPTMPLATASMSSSISPHPDFCSTDHLCENGGSCLADGLSYKCMCIGYFTGKNCSIDISSGAVVIVINMERNQFNETVLVQIVVEGLNSLCADGRESCPIPQSEGRRRRKRALPSATFKPEDVIVLEPEQVDANLQVELAVFKILADGSPSVVSSDKMSQIILHLAANISQRLGGRLISVKPKIQASTTQPWHSKTVAVPTTLELTVTTPAKQAPPGKAAASKAGTNGGVIGGVVVAVFAIIVIIAFSIWYFRVRTTIPYKQNTDVPTTHTTSFENPGYDNTAGFGTTDNILYEDIPPVVLSPYEDINEFGAASNPMYAAIDLEKFSSLVGKREDPDRSENYNVDNDLFGRKPGMPSNDTLNNISLENTAGQKLQKQEGSAVHLKADTRKAPSVLILKDSEGLGKDSEM